MDSITREIILKLTARVSDLEAGLEVHKNLLREIMQAQALLRNTSFIPAAFDLRIVEETTAVREKKASGVETPALTVGAPIYLEVPGET